MNSKRRAAKQGPTLSKGPTGWQQHLTGAHCPQHILCLHERWTLTGESRVEKWDSGLPKEQKRENWWDVEKKIVQKKKYWWLSEDGHLTPANPFPTGGRGAADSEHLILPLSHDWRKGCAGPWWMTDCVPWNVAGWDRKPKPSLLSVHQSSPHLHFSIAGCNTWFSAQILTRAAFSSPSVYTVFCFVVAFHAAECP